jgi:adenylylsulfate kinase-like enzyme
VPGVNVPYERAEAPELTLDTGALDAATAAERVAALGLGLDTGAGRRPAGGEGAVIWITGPPGSGKTTLANRLAGALSAEGVGARVLEWAALHASLQAGGPVGEAADEIGHRALAYTAKLLAEAGLTVVVDATAPRRAWRLLARTLTATFAEVQLVCPTEVCLNRERAVRWGWHAGGALDVAPEYEYADNPELLLDTASRSEWAAAEDLLRLARRLLRRRVAG